MQDFEAPSAGQLAAVQKLIDDRDALERGMAALTERVERLESENDGLRVRLSEVAKDARRARLRTAIIG
jgi:uncharacterized protein (UPF0335 family)